MQAITEIDGDTATVTALNGSDHPRLAARLLEAAGPGNARVVRIVSVKGGGRGFLVPAVVAYAAGLVPEEADDSAGDAAKKAPAKKSAPAKKATAAKATPSTEGGSSDVE